MNSQYKVVVVDVKNKKPYKLKEVSTGKFSEASFYTHKSARHASDKPVKLMD